MLIAGIAAFISFYLRERLPYWATLLFGIAGWIASFALFLWYTKSIQA